LGAGGWHAKAVPLEDFAQRRPGGPKLGGSGVDAAQPLGELEGGLDFGTVGEEAGGLPAHPPMYLVHVELSEACFGFEVNDQGVIVNAAPIARWTLGRRGRQVVAYYRRREAGSRGP
jgi:hypothetical protein